MSSKALIGAATRYLPGRNTVQTVYWRSSNDNMKMVKVSRNMDLGKAVKNASAPSPSSFFGAQKTSYTRL